MANLQRQLLFGANQAFRTIVPEAPDRIPITWNTSIYPVLCYVPYVFLAYLSRRPDTYLIRLLMLPSVITSILISAYRFTWAEPKFNVYNWGQCLFAAVFIAKSLEFAFMNEGILKIGESRPGVKKGKGKSVPRQRINGYVHHDQDQDDVEVDPPLTPSRHPLIAPWFYDAMEVSHTLRGLNWKFGQNLYIPHDPRPINDPPSFLHATFISFIQNFLALDFLESLIKLFPGLNQPFGGSMFYAELTPITRYGVSTLIHLLTGQAILSGFHMVYDLITLFAVGVLDSSPRSWPPVTDHPWRSSSMHEFWSKRWHQLLRQTFLVFGGYPGQWIAGNVGMLFGTFVASGLFHECAMYSMGRGYDHSALVFFAVQGLVLILERLWGRITGKRVSGLLGRLWVYLNMFIFAQPMVNAWHRRGLGGGLVIPPAISPARLVFLPIIEWILRRI